MIARDGGLARSACHCGRTPGRLRAATRMTAGRKPKPKPKAREAPAGVDAVASEAPAPDGAAAHAPAVDPSLAHVRTRLAAVELAASRAAAERRRDDPDPD